MKTLLQQKFQNINFVKPLYRKVKSSRVRPKKVFVSNIDNSVKLCGNGIYVKRKAFNNKNDDFDLISVKHKNSGYKTISGLCDNTVRVNIDKVKRNADEICNIIAKNSPLDHNMLSPIDKIQENKVNKSIQAAIIIQKVPDTWLRVYPAPQADGEKITSIIVRCVVCQLGMATFLVLWTFIWVFVIQSFEGPFEMEVSKDFEKQQNQLVIDLATELRQITPLSSAWRMAIERRIEDERKLTMLAVAEGAKLLPGQYWDLSGTFLFTVYVMTALGFGAPVPQTMWGRTSALIYALLAIPTHFYLMVNISTCAVVSVDAHVRRLQTKKVNRSIEDEAIFNRKESPNSKNSDLIKSRNKTLRQRLFCIIQVLSAGRFVPLAATLYYIIGLIAFGLLRNKSGTEMAMFPLQFTTSGGLEQVEFHVRILYGFYVEGAMTLLACTLATIRLHSSSTANSLAQQYRLFDSEEIK